MQARECARHNVASEKQVSVRVKKGMKWLQNAASLQGKKFDGTRGP